MKYEWKKQEKEFYGAKKSPALVTVPAQNYIMISGKGNPNDNDFSNRVFALYSLAYAIKMAYKAAAIQNEFHDFTVYPLEGIWQKTEETELVKENLKYTIMIRQPDFICEDMVKAALEQFALSNHLERTKSCHREIYLNNANRVEKSKLKTILRYAVK